MKNLNLPFAIDHGDRSKPSLPVLFAWISFFVALASIIALHFYHCAEASCAAIALWVIAMVFYRMHNIDRFKISRDSLELDSDNPQGKSP